MIGELREDERLFALFLDGGEQVEEHLQLAGTHWRGSCVPRSFLPLVVRMTIFGIVPFVSRLPIGDNIHYGAKPRVSYISSLV